MPYYICISSGLSDASLNMLVEGAGGGQNLRGSGFADMAKVRLPFYFSGHMP
jgi:hypothetical protein